MVAFVGRRDVFELDVLALHEVAVLFDRDIDAFVVDEHFLPVFSGDEAVASLLVEPFDATRNSGGGCHF